MKQPTTFVAAVIVMLMAAQLAATDTTFTYQGELKENGSPASGSFNMEFSLWDADIGGNQIGSTLSMSDVAVTEGRFTVSLDFGLGAFNNGRWLEIVVSGTTLSPRTSLTATPVAAQLLGTFVDPLTGYIGFNQNLPSARLQVEEDQSDAIWGISTKLGSAGVYGESNSGSGVVAKGLTGLTAETTSPGGFAIKASSPVGSLYTGIFTNDNPNGTAIYGAVTGNGAGTGVLGTASGADAKAIYGSNSAGWAGYFVGDGYFSERLLVGTDTPITGLDYLTLRTPAPNNIYGGMYIDTDGTTAFPFYGYATAGTSRMWTYYSGITGDWHVFNGGDERLSVEPSGEVGINETNPAYTLEVNGSAGKPGGGSWSNSSDIRLKKNIQGLKGALDSLLQLRGVTFEYKDPASINELHGQRIGVVAQEVENVFPDWVDQRDDGYMSVTFRGFEALTVEAVRELRAENEAEIERLNRRIDELEQLVLKLTVDAEEKK